MKKNALLTALVLFLALSFNSCTKDNEQHLEVSYQVDKTTTEYIVSVHIDDDVEVTSDDNISHSSFVNNCERIVKIQSFDSDNFMIIDNKNFDLLFPITGESEGSHCFTRSTMFLEKNGERLYFTIQLNHE